MKTTIQKQENIGNTFTGLICAAFDCESKDIKQDPFLQYHRQGMGTIEVCGHAYDWFDRGESVDFIPSGCGYEKEAI